jgi:hypothetical protein
MCHTVMIHFEAVVEGWGEDGGQKGIVCVCMCVGV